MSGSRRREEDWWLLHFRLCVTKAYSWRFPFLSCPGLNPPRSPLPTHRPLKSVRKSWLWYHSNGTASVILGFILSHILNRPGLLPVQFFVCFVSRVRLTKPVRLRKSFNPWDRCRAREWSLEQTEMTLRLWTSDDRTAKPCQSLLASTCGNTQLLDVQKIRSLGFSPG